jgi:hypothetical protein
MRMDTGKTLILNPSKFILFPNSYRIKSGMRFYPIMIITSGCRETTSIIKEDESSLPFP